MTDTSGTSGTSSDAEAGAEASLSWSTLVDDWVDFGKELADRFSDKASARSEGIRARSYSADDWVADVDWFWDHVHKDAVRAAQYWRDKIAPK